ncbi:hypothetical protein B0H16DRAFT_1762313 [Mycena metata]|uniref:NACHT domain-containing protein n=1 Tax=Mycena metata TaxID=1033252 RepID=A0AAD7IAB7_9AGAR|nr:hypothetical protein B0H16DRAFT_1762313 [Mycena metata]
MPSSKLDARRDELADYGLAACHALQVVADDQKIPFLQTAVGISQLIMESIQRVKANKSQCRQLLDQVHKILCILVNLCGDFEAPLSVALLHSLSQFIETLQKVHGYVRAQADLGMFKRIVKQSENASQFNECTAELRQALESFGASTHTLPPLCIHMDAAQRHEELMAFVAQMNDAASTHSTHSFNRTALRRSSSSLSLLPGSPKIFYGREQELTKIVTALTASDSARVAILGSGGMGKTSLALAAVHHTDIVTMFGTQRFFIPLTAAVSATDLIAKVAQYFGLEQQGRLQKNILRHLCAIPAPVLLVLDNMEDCWESLAGRPQVEDFLSHLSDVPGLRLLVTMRGMERPNQVKWSRPFLPALTPLDADAARSTFFDITDEVTDEKIVNKLLALTDHLPLAISLMANLASFDGCETVLERWNSETTSLLSDGADKLSNLDTSIMISLTSPRMKSNPNALKVLSVMALLPDGVSRADLEEMNLPLADVAWCISTLMRCALCYLDSDHRFKLLAPISQYARRQCPVSEELQRPLREHFYNVANLFTVPDFLSPLLVHRLSSDLGNIRSVVLHSLGSTDHRQLVQTLGCVIKLAGFTYLTNLGSLEGLDSLQELVATLDEPRLEGQYLYITGYLNHPKLEYSSRRALQCFERAGDLISQGTEYNNFLPSIVSRLSKAMAYRALGFHYQVKRDGAKTTEALSAALELAKKAGTQPNHLADQAATLVQMLQFRNTRGLSDTLPLAYEAHEIAHASGHLWIEASTLRMLASTCERMGDYTRARGFCVQAKALLSALALDGSHVSVFRRTTNTEAEIALQQTNYVYARSLNMSLVTPEESQTGFSHQEISNGYALINIAYIDIATGKHSAAGSTLNLARSLFNAHNSRFGEIACDITLGDFHTKIGEYAEARRLYLQCLPFPSAELRTLCFEKLSDVALLEQEVTLAQRFATLLLIHAFKSGYQAKMHRALRRLGDVFLADGDDTSAMLLFDVALAGFTLMDIHRAKAECWLRMGDIHASRGDSEAARVAWEAARPEFEKSSQHEEVAECDKRLAV